MATSTPHSPPGKTWHPARAVRQERSRLTLQRILVAAERLLETREFDALSMADLAREAGCAVGTLYGRLPNKDSLLVCLHERYVATGLTASAGVFQACGDAGLEVRARALCGLVVEFLATRRGVTRAVTTHLFSRPGDDPHGFRESATESFKQAAAFLAEKVDTRLHPDPQESAEFALLAAFDVAQSRIVYGDRSGIQIQYPLDDLEARITTLVLAYLQSKP
jgi:AcrR family transcriptional regulator